MADVSPAFIHRIAEQTMRYPFKVWGFGEGIALEALADASDIQGKNDYWPFILQLFDQWVSRPLEESDHSAPGMLLLTAHERTHDERYLTRAQQLAEHMRSLPSCENGAWLHRPQHPEYHDYLYVDCMEVDAPFLCKLAAINGDASLFDVAARQVLTYADVLQDDKTGLFFHQFDRSTGRVNGAFWGRGNGWALLGLLKTLELLPPSHADYASIHERFVRLAGALVKRQAKSGGWHTVLDQPETYQEASLSAMFGYGLIRARQQKLISFDVSATVERAWQAVKGEIWDGVLTSVSVATPPGDADHYADIDVGSGYPWGQGPLLFLALSRKRA